MQWVNTQSPDPTGLNVAVYMHNLKQDLKLYKRPEVAYIMERGFGQISQWKSVQIKVKIT